MLPLSDGLARRFPVVTIALIAAKLALWSPTSGGFLVAYALTTLD